MTDILSTLKFVQGAVSRKKFEPALTHFRIEDGNIRSYNGVLALSSPIELDINCTPKAVDMVKAITNCTETTALSMTAAGRLSIKSGPFKAFINCIDEVTPHVVPEGEIVNFDGEEFIKALRKLSPFIGDDASRPWSNGILLADGCATATNNVIAAQYWLGTEFPVRCNVPAVAIKELLRIKQIPTHAQINDTSITFHFEDKRWIRSTLLGLDWPDLNGMLGNGEGASPIREDLFVGLEAIEKLCDQMGRVYLRNDRISTMLESDDGASYELPGLGYEGVYKASMLKLLGGIATHADFSQYPSACPFYGDKLRGVIMGLRT